MTGECLDCGLQVNGDADEYGYLDDCECGGSVRMLVTSCNLCERAIPSTPFPALCPRCRGAAQEAGRQANDAMRYPNPELEQFRR